MTVNITVASDDIETSKVFSQAIAEFLVGKGCMGVVETGSHTDYSLGTDTSTVSDKEISMIEESHAQRDGVVPTLLDHIAKANPDFLINHDIRVTPTIYSQVDLDIEKLKERGQLLSAYHHSAVRSVNDIKDRLQNLVKSANDMVVVDMDGWIP